MTQIVSPVKAKAEYFGKRKIDNKTKLFYRPVRFVVLSQQEDSKDTEIWKVLTDADCDRIPLETVVYLVPTGETKRGRDKYRVVLAFE